MAINTSYIHKFFNKPWEDYELLQTVKQALQQRELEEENLRLKGIIKEQQNSLDNLKLQHPGIAECNVDSEGCIIIEE